MTAWNFTKKTTVREISKQFDQIAAALRRNLAAKVWIFTAEIILRIMSAPQVDLGTCQPGKVIQFLGAFGNLPFLVRNKSSRERWSWWIFVYYLKSSVHQIIILNLFMTTTLVAWFHVIWNHPTERNGGLRFKEWYVFGLNLWTRGIPSDPDTGTMIVRTSRMIFTNREVLYYAYFMCFLWYGFVLNFKTLPSQRQRRAVKRPKLSLRLFSCPNPFGIDLGVGGFCFGIRSMTSSICHVFNLGRLGESYWTIVTSSRWSPMKSCRHLPKEDLWWPCMDRQETPRWETRFFRRPKFESATSKDVLFVVKVDG